MISDLTAIPFSITEDNGTLNVFWSESNARSSIQNVDLIQVTDIRIEGIDLYLNYTIPEQGDDSEIGLSLETSDSTLIVANRKDLVDEPSERGEDSKTLIWRNIIGSNIDISENYTLLIRTDIYIDLCAGEAPTLNTSKQLPYYGGVVLGLGLIGAGQLIKSRADRTYKNYEQLWKDGNVSDQGLLEDVDSDKETANILTGAGIGVLALDAVLYYLKNKNHRKAVRRYNTFCVGRKEVNIHPKQDDLMNMGIMLQLNF